VKPDLDDLPPDDRDLFAVEGEIARGGLGRVLRARHRGMRRVVAVKELLPEAAEYEARFA
jgi:hypothetical protein